MNQENDNSNNNTIQRMSAKDGENRIVEDAPRMRSVQVKPLSPTLLMPSPHLSSKSTMSVPPATEQQLITPPKPPAAGWDVGTLEPIPTIYVIERTHAFCNDIPSAVANRITECLRTNSMAARHHPNEASLDVETLDNVQFTIRLWAGENGPNHVLVEVQRVSGCSYSYCQAAKSVLRAAKGIKVTGCSSLNGHSSLKRSFPIPSCIPKMENQERLEATRGGLEIAEQLLNQNRLDTRLLAAQSLEHLSRCEENRTFASKYILSSKLFVSSLMEVILTSPVPDDDASNASEIEKTHLKQIRRLSFVILANCLSAMDQSGELAHFLQTDRSLLSRNVLTALSNELAVASDRPNEACQAAECLRVLMRVSDEVRRHAMEYGIPNVVSHAHEVGMSRHFGLERACSKLLPCRPQRNYVVE